MAERDKREEPNPVDAIRALDVSKLPPPPIPPEITALEGYMKQVQSGPKLPSGVRKAFVDAVNERLDQTNFRVMLDDGRLGRLCIRNGSIQVQLHDGGSAAFLKRSFHLRPYVRMYKERGNPIDAIRELDLSKLAPPPIPPEIVALERYMKEVQAGPIVPLEQRTAFVAAVNERLEESGFRIVVGKERIGKLSIKNGAIQVQLHDGGTVGFRKHQFSLRPYARRYRQD